MTSRVVAVMLWFAALSVSADECPVTISQGDWYGNESLQAALPGDGTIVFKPGGAGFVDRDGALGIKFPWRRLVPGMLRIGGRRLDGEAPPARAYMSEGYGDRGFQPSYLVFPTPGCWEITGGLGEARLTFVLRVEKVGAGPGWRFEGIGPEWRESHSPDEK